MKTFIEKLSYHSVPDIGQMHYLDNLPIFFLSFIYPYRNAGFPGAFSLKIRVILFKFHTEAKFLK